MEANPTPIGIKAKPPSATTLPAMDTPTNGVVTRSIAGTTTIGRTPNSTQTSARPPMPMRIVRGTSCACLAWALLGIARNEIPNALAKQASASTPVSANMAAPIGSIILRSRSGI